MSETIRKSSDFEEKENGVKTSPYIRCTTPWTQYGGSYLKKSELIKLKTEVLLKICH